MKKLSFLFVLAFFCALPAFAQTTTEFTFSDKETADDFPLKGKSITVEGQLVATDMGSYAGSPTIYFEIRYYLHKRSQDVVLTKVELQTPKTEKSETKYPVRITYFYFTKESLPYIAISASRQEGFCNIEATIDNSSIAKGFYGIQAEVISVEKAEKERLGYDKDSSLSGFRRIQVGKFASSSDIEKFKKMLVP